MTPDQEAIKRALGWVGQDGSKPKRHPSLSKKLDEISRRRGLKELTRSVVRTARDCIDVGNYGLAWRYLKEYEERLS